MNYAEEVAYWYLRLNGFFPLTRFVLHRNRYAQPRLGPADADLLALRLPAVEERIGGTYVDFDPELRRVVPFDTETDVVLFVVDVKGGDSVGRPELVFNQERLSDAVKRAGRLVPKLRPKVVLDTLCKRPHYHDRGAFVGKLYIAQSLDHPCRDSVSCAKDRYEMSLVHAVTFIRNRFATYEEKKSDWNHFPSDLAQFLIWHDQLCPSNHAATRGAKAAAAAPYPGDKPRTRTRRR